jgi:surfactin synthase thioesterase subunit
MPAEVEVCPILLPGRERRLAETPFTRLIALVEALAKELLPYLDIPFAFMGHSVGALISFELIHYLQEHHELSPVHLFVSGAGAPHLPDPEPAIHELPEPDFVAELRRLNGTPDTVLEHAELMALMMPVLRADFAVYETYAYSAKPPLNCPITAFGGLQDARVSQERIEGWRDHTTASFALKTYPGDHFFIHQAEAFLLQIISQTLQQHLSR